MPFSNVIFIFAYLPVFLICYYLGSKLCGPKKNLGQNIMLLLGSLIFYAWGEGYMVLVLVASWIVNHFLAMGIERYRFAKRYLLVLTIVLNVSVLAYFKCTSLPAGLSFFTFQALSYVFDVYSEKIKAERNILKTGMYITLFPTLLSGPIIRYDVVASKYDNRTVSMNDVAGGVRFFIRGFGMKVLIADSLALIADRIFDYIAGGFEAGASLAWLGAIVYTLEIYFDFAGYSYMAIGLGKMLGFDIPQNFDYPYLAGSVKEFWRKWHISLSSWFRDYVYIPFGGSKKGLIRTILNLLIVWVLTGIWHGTGLTFIVWGLMYFAVLTAERISGYGTKWKLPAGISNIYTMLVVTVGWVIFRSNSLTDAYRFLRRMAGLGTTGFGDYQTLTYITNNLPVLLAACVFVFPVWKLIEKHKVLEDVILAVVFLLSLIFMLKSGYSPFIYFKF